MDYQEHIVSTEENATFLHKCFSMNIEDVMSSGVICSANPLSTMTWQPRELERALGIYRNGMLHGDCAVVVKIPRQLWERAHRNNFQEEALDESIGYYHELRKDFAVKPKFVKGWIDRKTDKYHPKKI